MKIYFISSIHSEQFNYITNISERSNELDQQANTLAEEVKKFKI
ncbi:hypothetical protein [Paenibacillus xylanexedens]|nr:hypothetical protein [Paenibacillus xylanexedens]